MMQFGVMKVPKRSVTESEVTCSTKVCANPQPR